MDFIESYMSELQLMGMMNSLLVIALASILFLPCVTQRCASELLGDGRMQMWTHTMRSGGLWPTTLSHRIGPYEVPCLHHRVFPLRGRISLGGRVDCATCCFVCPAHTRPQRDWPLLPGVHTYVAGTSYRGKVRKNVERIAILEGGQADETAHAFSSKCETVPLPIACCIPPCLCCWLSLRNEGGDHHKEGKSAELDHFDDLFGEGGVEMVKKASLLERRAAGGGLELSVQGPNGLGGIGPDPDLEVELPLTSPGVEAPRAKGVQRGSDSARARRGGEMSFSTVFGRDADSSDDDVAAALKRGRRRVKKKSAEGTARVGADASTAEESESSSSNEGAAPLLSGGVAAPPGLHAKTITLDVRILADDAFTYVDDDDLRHGPFAAREILEWFSGGFFAREKQLRIERNEELVKLGDVVDFEATAEGGVIDDEFTYIDDDGVVHGPFDIATLRGWHVGGYFDSVHELRGNLSGRSETLGDVLERDDKQLQEQELEREELERQDADEAEDEAASAAAEEAADEAALVAMRKESAAACTWHQPTQAMTPITEVEHEDRTPRSPSPSPRAHGRPSAVSDWAAEIEAIESHEGPGRARSASPQFRNAPVPSLADFGRHPSVVSDWAAEIAALDSGEGDATAKVKKKGSQGGRKAAKTKKKTKKKNGVDLRGKLLRVLNWKKGKAAQHVPTEEEKRATLSTWTPKAASSEVDATKRAEPLDVKPLAGAGLFLDPFAHHAPHVHHASAAQHLANAKQRHSSNVQFASPMTVMRAQQQQQIFAKQRRTSHVEFSNPMAAMRVQSQQMMGNPMTINGMRGVQQQRANRAAPQRLPSLSMMPIAASTRRPSMVAMQPLQPMGFGGGRRPSLVAIQPILPMTAARPAPLAGWSATPLSPGSTFMAPSVHRGGHSHHNPSWAVAGVSSHLSSKMKAIVAMRRLEKEKQASPQFPPRSQAAELSARHEAERRMQREAHEAERRSISSMNYSATTINVSTLTPKPSFTAAPSIAFRPQRRSSLVAFENALAAFGASEADGGSDDTDDSSLGSDSVSSRPVPKHKTRFERHGVGQMTEKKLATLAAMGGLNDDDFQTLASHWEEDEEGTVSLDSIRTTLAEDDVMRADWANRMGLDPSTPPGELATHIFFSINEERRHLEGLAFMNAMEAVQGGCGDLREADSKGERLCTVCSQVMLLAALFATIFTIVIISIAGTVEVAKIPAMWRTTKEMGDCAAADASLALSHFASPLRNLSQSAIAFVDDGFNAIGDSKDPGTFLPILQTLEDIENDMRSDRCKMSDQSVASNNMLRYLCEQTAAQAPPGCMEAMAVGTQQGVFPKSKLKIAMNAIGILNKYGALAEIRGDVGAKIGPLFSANRVRTRLLEARGRLKAARAILQNVSTAALAAVHEMESLANGDATNVSPLTSQRSRADALARDVEATTDWILWLSVYAAATLSAVCSVLLGSTIAYRMRERMGFCCCWCNAATPFCRTGPFSRFRGQCCRKKDVDAIYCETITVIACAKGPLGLHFGIDLETCSAILTREPDDAAVVHFENPGALRRGDRLVQANFLEFSSFTFWDVNTGGEVDIGELADAMDVPGVRTVWVSREGYSEEMDGLELAEAAMHEFDHFETGRIDGADRLAFLEVMLDGFELAIALQQRPLTMTFTRDPDFEKHHDGDREALLAARIVMGTRGNIVERRAHLALQWGSIVGVHIVTAWVWLMWVITLITAFGYIIPVAVLVSDGCTVGANLLSGDQLPRYLKSSGTLRDPLAVAATASCLQQSDTLAALGIREALDLITGLDMNDAIKDELFTKETTFAMPKFTKQQDLFGHAMGNDLGLDKTDLAFPNATANMMLSVLNSVTNKKFCSYGETCRCKAPQLHTYTVADCTPFNKSHGLVDHTCAPTVNHNEMQGQWMNGYPPYFHCYTTLITARKEMMTLMGIERCVHNQLTLNKQRNAFVRDAVKELWKMMRKTQIDLDSLKTRMIPITEGTFEMTQNGACGFVQARSKAILNYACGPMFTQLIEVLWRLIAASIGLFIAAQIGTTTTKRLRKFQPYTWLTRQAELDARKGQQTRHDRLDAALSDVTRLEELRTAEMMHKPMSREKRKSLSFATNPLASPTVGDMSMLPSVGSGGGSPERRASNASSRSAGSTGTARSHGTSSHTSTSRRLVSRPRKVGEIKREVSLAQRRGFGLSVSLATEDMSTVNPLRSDGSRGGTPRHGRGPLHSDGSYGGSTPRHSRSPGRSPGRSPVRTPRGAARQGWHSDSGESDSSVASSKSGAAKRKKERRKSRDWGKDWRDRRKYEKKQRRRSRRLSDAESHDELSVNDVLSQAGVDTGGPPGSYSSGGEGSYKSRRPSGVTSLDSPSSSSSRRPSWKEAAALAVRGVPSPSSSLGSTTRSHDAPPGSASRRRSSASSPKSAASRRPSNASSQCGSPKSRRGSGASPAHSGGVSVQSAPSTPSSRTSSRAGRKMSDKLGKARKVLQAKQKREHAKKTKLAKRNSLTRPSRYGRTPPSSPGKSLKSPRLARSEKSKAERRLSGVDREVQRRLARMTRQ